MSKRTYERRISPANLSDLPSVLDVEDVSNVLRISQAGVRELANAGRLRRVSYSRPFLFSAAEVRRFLREETENPVKLPPPGIREEAS